MKSLLLGIVLIVLVGLGGFMYRNAIENRSQPAAGCTMEAKVCPDGTSVGRSGPSCAFAECPPPNVTLADVSIAFALPTALTATTPPDAASVAAYEFSGAASTDIPYPEVIIRRYAIASSSTALDTIKATAIGGTSGEPVPTTLYSSTIIAGHRFTVVSIERFEATVHTAYYLARGEDVLRFDAIDRDVFNWTDPSLDVSQLPAARALRELLGTLQVNSL